MEPKIVEWPEKKLVGMRLPMTMANNKTRALWSGFMPRRREITNKLNDNLYSMQVYDATMDFSRFQPDISFEKWAAVEVPDFDAVPDGMETYVLPGGLYAVFLHTGGPATGAATFQFIFGTWLPASAFMIDNRPHFELLGAKYKNDDPASEEEIYIPIRPKPVTTH